MSFTAHPRKTRRSVMRADLKECPLSRGDVAFFHFVHLDGMDNEKRKWAGSEDVDWYWWDVPTKARRMLVLYLSHEAYGRCWYRVVKLTKRGYRRDGSPVDNHVCVGCLLAKDVKTYAERD